MELLQSGKTMKESAMFNHIYKCEKSLVIVLMIVSMMATTVATAADLPKKKNVFVKKMVSTEISDYFTYPAESVSEINGDITAPIDGTILKIKKTLGAKINRGDEILSIQRVDPLQNCTNNL